MVLKLCDENDKAKDLNDYFKNTLQNHIKNTIVPHLRKQREDTLLKEFVRQWQNYTILVHFMRKMFNYLVISPQLTLSLGQVLLEEYQYANPRHEFSTVLQGAVLRSSPRQFERSSLELDHKGQGWRAS
jgi:hypothetical protein